MIESDASKTGWRAFYKKTSIAGVWSQAEQALHINILELRAEKFAILTFSIYNKELAALAYLVKMGRTAAPTRDSGGKENMGIFFSQSDHTYCRVPAKDFKYQSRQGFQGNEKFFKRMDIKQANISETDAGFRTSGCRSV